MCKSKIMKKEPGHPWETHIEEYDRDSAIEHSKYTWHIRHSGQYKTPEHSNAQIPSTAVVSTTNSDA